MKQLPVVNLFLQKGQYGLGSLVICQGPIWLETAAQGFEPLSM